MSDADPPIEAVAAITQRLAVLLAAGVAPAAAWRYLSESDAGAREPARGTAERRPVRVARLGRARAAGDRAGELDVRVLRAATRAGARGENSAEAIRAAVAAGGPGPVQEQRAAAAWMALAAAWAVASEAGAPLAVMLRALAMAFRDQAQLERDLAVALAGPRATAKMVGAMPAVGVVFGSLMGFDTVRTLLFTPPGLLCLVLGAALMFAGARWSGALVRRAGGVGGDGGLLFELTAIAMSGGMAADRALALAANAVERYAAAPGGGDTAAIDGVLRLARRAGVPAAELLRSEAHQARQRARSAGQQRAARLGVTLMIPLGLCILPAFMLLGVLPLLISVLSSTLSTF